MSVSIATVRHPGGFADLDHRLCEFMARLERLHEGARPDLDVQHQSVADRRKLLAHDRGSDQRD